MYVQLFWEFFTIGLFTLGGGTAMIAVLQDRLEKRKWMEEDEILDCIVVSQTLPGVVALNMSVYVGYRVKGFLGAVVSVIGMILPSFVIIIIISLFLNNFSENKYIKGAMVGIRAAATGLIVYVAGNLARKTFKKCSESKADLIFSVIVIALSFTLIAVVGIDAVWVILGAVIAGMIYYTKLVIGCRDRGGKK